MPVMEDHQVHIIPMKDIIVEGRSRKEFRNLADLSESIKSQGLIHPPTVSMMDDGKIHLVAGERRFKAALMAGMTDIPCYFREELPELELREMELEENLQREDVSYEEQNEALMKIENLKMDRLGKSGPNHPEGWNQEKLANLVGMSKSSVRAKVQLAKDFDKRPDIAGKVRHLPETAARKEYNRIVKQESTARKIANGDMQVSTDIIHGFMRTELPKIPDNSVHCVVTDPPFGISELQAELAEKEVRKVGDKIKDKTDSTQLYRLKIGKYDNLSSQQALDNMDNFIPHLARVLRPGCYFYIFFENLMTISEVAQMLEEHNDLVLMKPAIIWDKRRTSNTFTGYNYPSCTFR